MLIKVRQSHFHCFYICLFWSIKGWCSPWIVTLEPHLHQDLQVLVEWEVLDASVSSYPVPWKGIAEQLEKLQVNSLPSKLSSEYSWHPRAAIEALFTSP